jgi:hypothetical protein
VGGGPPPVGPPLEPAEYVELAQPPSIEPRILGRPNMVVTTLDGQPLDLAQAPPDKIAIGDLDPDGRSTITLEMTIDSAGRSPATSIEYRVDGRLVKPPTPFDRPITPQRDAVQLSLAPGPHRFTAEVVNQYGIRRSITRDILVRGLPRPRTTRLKLVTIAPAYREPRIEPIQFAERDARELRKFLTRYLVSPESGEALYSIDEDPLEGPTATADRVKKAVAALQDKSLGEGDLVVVVIESHFLNVASQRKLLAADGLKVPPTPAVAADDLARNLGTLCANGCRVIVLVDGVHASTNKDWDPDIGDWVRHLRDVERVITFVASNSGPSQAVQDQGHRAFAQAVLDAVKASSGKDNTSTLNDFRDVVVERVLELTQRQQHAACYLPESINGQFKILNPQATGR